MSYKVLIVGLGKIALGYDLEDTTGIRTHSKAFDMHSGFSLVAAIDPDSKARDRFEKVYNVNAYRSIDDLTKNSKLKDFDVIVISTPTVIRIEVLQKIVDCNIKCRILLIEKPIALSEKNRSQINDLILNITTHTFVNYIRRSDKGFNELKSIITSGKLGELKSGEVNYHGGFKNISSHYIDILSFLFDSKCEVGWTEIISEYSENDYKMNFILNILGAQFSFYSVDTEELSLKILFKNGYIEVLDAGKIINVSKGKDLWKIETELLFYQYNVVDKLYGILKYNKKSTLCDQDEAWEIVNVCDKIFSSKI